MGSGDVVCYLRGGLGNQLFQYAAAFAVAQRSGGQVKIYKEAVDLHHGPYCLNKIIKNYQETDQVIHYNKWQHFLFRRGWHSSLYIERCIQNYNPAFELIRAPIQLYGFFFSWRYFEAYEEALREQFVWPIYSDDIKAVEKKMNCENKISIGLHVRRGDFLDPEVQKRCGIRPLPLSYYERSVALMKACLGGNLHFYIFSNDSDYVKRNFDFCPLKTILDPQSHEPYEALFLMSQCDHMILSNSTFSWWGGWLCWPRGGYIVAPQEFCPRYAAVGFNKATLFI